MKRTLTITIDDDWQSDLRRAAKRAAEGGYQGERLGFATPGLFFGKLTERRWELVRVLQRDGVAGVRELARRVERDVRRVHDDVGVLLELGLIEKDEQGKLLCPYADIHVDMHLKAA